MTFVSLSEVTVTRACLRCYPEAKRAPRTTLVRIQNENDLWLVSPSGVVHIADDYGMTACGHDATGDGWWWRT